jgi:hypothetical protein
MQISFNVVCANDGKGKSHSTMFANALQDRYALKKVNNSASLGVGVLGSVSMPIGSTDDSMVKVASETVSAPKFLRALLRTGGCVPAPRGEEDRTYSRTAQG